MREEDHIPRKRTQRSKPNSIIDVSAHVGHSTVKYQTCTYTTVHNTLRSEARKQRSSALPRHLPSLASWHGDVAIVQLNGLSHLRFRASQVLLVLVPLSLLRRSEVLRGESSNGAFQSLRGQVGSGKTLS